MNCREFEASKNPVPLAIIGMGCIFPKAKTLKAYWANIREGVDAIGEVPTTHWNPADYFHADPKKPDHTYASRGGFLPAIDFRPLEYGITPSAIEATDTSQLLGLVAARQALEDAGYGADRDFDRGRTSVILGVTGALELVIPLGARLGHPLWRKALLDLGISSELADKAVERISRGYVEWQENSFPGLLGNVVAGRIANRLDLGGTNCVVDAACASSLSALHLASLELQSGLSDMVVTGGVDTFNDIFMYMCFSKTPALSPTGDSRPFAADGDGTILGEGIGILVVKRLADAERDGDRIYAKLLSVGSSSDGKGNAIYAPSSEGQKKALKRAYQLARVAPDSIDLLEAHGTGTRVGDAAELAALMDVYGSSPRNDGACAIGSVKSQIGHTKAAAGAAGVIKAALSLHFKTLPPSIKVDRPLQPLIGRGGPFYLNSKKRPWAAGRGGPRRAAVSAFGFGGSNFHCVLEEHTPSKTGVEWRADVELAAFSGMDAAELETKSRQLDALPSWDDVRRAAAESRKTFDATAAYRLVRVLVEDEWSAHRDGRQRNPIPGRSGDGKSQPGHGRGITHRGTATASRLAAIFSGQGSQRLGMCRDLACQFPEMLAALELANRVFGEHRSESQWNRQPAELRSSDHRKLSDFIYPPEAYDRSMAAQDELDLRATDVAQPALAAMELGLTAILDRFGVRFDGVAGHSFGELTALWAAGAFDSETFLRLACIRGSSMAKAAGDAAGAMLAVIASPEQIDVPLRPIWDRIFIANKNSSHQTVLSGSLESIEEAAGLLESAGIRSLRLPVSAAFHSPAVSAAAAEFKSHCQTLEFRPLRMPAYSNASAERYPDDSAEALALLAGQLAKTVEFKAMIDQMTKDGFDTFVEIGPGAKLAKLIGREFGVRSLAIESSEGSVHGMIDLANLLAALAAAGHAVRLDEWNKDELLESMPGSGKPAFSITLSGANHLPAERKAAWLTNEPPSLSTERAAQNPTDEKVLFEPTHDSPAPRRATLPDNAKTTVLPSLAKGLTEKHDRYSPAEEKIAGKTLMNLNHASLEMIQRNLDALRKMQEQTSAVHLKYLEGQEAALANYRLILETQASLFGNGRQSSAGEFNDRNGKRESAPFPRIADSATPNSPVLVDVASAVDVAPRSAAANLPRDDRNAEPAKMATPSSAPASSIIAKGLLEIVGEKTGYPVEMLSLEMELDADLGIDSIKRVEILAAMQDRYPNVAAVSSDRIGSIRTLGEVLEHLGVDETTASSGRSSPSLPGAAADANESANKQNGRLIANGLAEGLLDIVAEKTGYPVEMLDLKMELDSDLGIDSIKRVEILASVQERFPEAPAIASDRIGSIRTLGEVLEHLAVFPSAISNEKTNAAEAASRPVGAEKFIPVAGVNSMERRLKESLLEIVAEKTGYPVEMLDLDMQLDSDLGIDSIKRVEILAAVQDRLPGLQAVTSEQIGALRTLREVVSHLEGDNPADSPRAAIAPDGHASSLIPETAESANEPLCRYLLRTTPSKASVAEERLELCGDAETLILSEDPRAGAELSRALQDRGIAARQIPEDVGDVELSRDRISGLILVAAEDRTNAKFLAGALDTVRRLKPAICAGGRSGGALFASITRIDGRFGLRRPRNPLAGALAGLVKTASREWPEVFCRAIDASDDVEWNAIVAELHRKGPTEIGIEGDARIELVLDKSDVGERQGQPTLSPGDIVVVSGGARGVTASVSMALATKYRPHLVLLGRTAVSLETEPDWQILLRTEAELRQGLSARAMSGATPKQVAMRARQVLANREASATLKAIRQTGATVEYRCLDIRDGAAVRSLFEELRKSHGPVAGVVHGAGVLADRLIENCGPKEFDEVFGVKVGGLENLLDAARGDPLKLLVTFSSTTARLGRRGQAAYAMANEALNKMAQLERRYRPECKVISANWGPWNGGMVTPQLSGIFASEGIGLIGLEAGAHALVREIENPLDDVEVIFVGSPLSDAMIRPECDAIFRKADAAAAVNPPKVPQGNSAKSASASGNAAGRKPSSEVAFEREMELAAHPVLESHVLDGRPVVPLALSMEWMAHASLHLNPGLAWHGFDSVRVLKGLHVEAGKKSRLRVVASKAEKRDGLFWTPVEVQTTRGESAPTTHVTAMACLAAELPTSKAALLPVRGSFPWDANRVYEQYLFHGPELRGIERIDACDAQGIVATLAPAPPPEAWILSPLRGEWLSDPLAIDAVFQLMIVWTFENYGVGSLPTSLGRYRQFMRRFPASGVQTVVRIARHSPHTAVADVELLDEAGELVGRIDSYECTLSEGLRRAFSLNRLEAVAGR